MNHAVKFIEWAPVQVQSTGREKQAQGGTPWPTFAALTTCDQTHPAPGNALGPHLGALERTDLAGGSPVS